MTLQQLLGIELPIVQAPMAGAHKGALAAAVCGAGGLGSLPCAVMGPDEIREEAASIRTQTDKPFNINFFCHAPPVVDDEREAAWHGVLTRFYEEHGIDPAAIPAGPGRNPFDDEAAALLEELKPAVVSFHFGLPEPELFARVKALGAVTMCSATTVAEARWLEEKDVDVIIAQGAEAGGHRGMFLSRDLTTQVGTFALLPQVVRAVSRPVIAAGGIADAAGVKAAMALGASGVQVGTGFLLCPESEITPIHRSALKSEAARHTAITNLFTGRPARGIVNRIIQELGPVRTDVPEFPLATGAITPLRAKAEAGGSGDFSPLWSGQNASGAREIPAAELTRKLAGF